MKQARKRLFIDIKTNAREREKLIKMAVENECDTLVFSLEDKFLLNKKFKYGKLIKHYELNIEAGGRDFHLLLPKKLFFFNRDLFRMEQGKRKKHHHFCPTNPRTIAIIAENANILLSRAMKVVTSPRIFHLLPEEGYESIWCQCPACRAFRPAEQYLIAVNIVADELAKLDPEAELVYIDFDTEPDSQGISPRANMIPK